MTRRGLIVTFLLAAAATAAAAQGRPADPTIAPLADEALTLLREASPLFRLKKGLPLDSLPDVSFSSIERYAKRARDLQARLRSVREETLAREGWGEYAALLAGKMGVYTDPYDRYGRLAMEMFYARPGPRLQGGDEPIVDLHERARSALGVGFDIRRFHDCILGSGSLPMSALSRHVDEFIRREKAP
jgi:hypothetical protein